MQFHFVSVPVDHAAPAQAELNRFLNQRRVLGVDRQLVNSQQSPVWAICVTYLEGPAALSAGSRGANEPSSGKSRPKVDYKEVLSPEDFAVFAKMRELRKQMAESEGVPPYALFNNEQLAIMVQQRIVSKEKLGQIPGVGAARVTKYGDAFISAIRQQFTNGNQS